MVFGISYFISDLPYLVLESSTGYFLHAFENNITDYEKLHVSAILIYLSNH